MDYPLSFSNNTTFILKVINFIILLAIVLYFIKLKRQPTPIQQGHPIRRLIFAIIIGLLIGMFGIYYLVTHWTWPVIM
jgi:uncharacterized membrane protein YfcA